MSITSALADRVQRLPESYVFGDIARRKAEARQSGLEIIDFGIGDPNFGPPPAVLEELSVLSGDPKHHRYPDTEGTEEYRTAWALFYEREFGVHLDPATEVHHLIGGKEGICSFPMAFVNPGDTVICPDPGYPVYDEGSIMAGGDVFYLPLESENGFLPQFQDVPDDVAARARIIWTNSPGNPTGAIADLAYFAALVNWANEHDVIVASDATYCHVKSGEPAPSFLMVPGAMEVGVEFNSLSKILCATGDRLGVVVGNADIIAGLNRVKATADSGGPNYIQLAYARHMLTSELYQQEMNAMYDQKRTAVAAMLERLGFKAWNSGATFYVWAANPEGFPESERLAYDLIAKKGVVCVPGKGLGRKYGEGFTRLSVAAVTHEEIATAESLIGEFLEEAA